MEQGLEFGFAVLSEAGVDGVEVGVVVAGVAEELEGAIGDGLQEPGEGSGVEVACGGDADRAVGCFDVGGCTSPEGFEAVEGGDLDATLERGGCCGLCKGWFEGIAQGYKLTASEDRAEFCGD